MVAPSLSQQQAQPQSHGQYPEASGRPLKASSQMSGTCFPTSSAWTQDFALHSPLSYSSPSCSTHSSSSTSTSTSSTHSSPFTALSLPPLHVPQVPISAEIHPEVLGISVPSSISYERVRRTSVCFLKKFPKNSNCFYY